MRIVTFLCILLLFAATSFAESDQRGLTARPKAPTGESVAGDQWVLTIGIDSYISWPRLKTAVNDAKMLKNVLLERYHVDSSKVIELYNENATRKNILAALRDLTKKIKAEDSLLIYYAGHGHIDSITKKGSWIPVESSTDDPSAWIDNRSITDYLSIDAIKARHVLLVSDSCFSGDFFRGNRAGLPDINDAFLKKAYTRSSRQAISSGGLEPVSDAGFGGNSVFGHFLITALNKNTKQYLLPSELFNEIRAGVGNNAEQLPQFGNLHGVGGQDGGELILFLKNGYVNKTPDMDALSVARQKELEQLKKMEREAADSKQRDLAEKAKKQAELDNLAKQIAEMKGRLANDTSQNRENLHAKREVIMGVEIEIQENNGKKSFILVSDAKGDGGDAAAWKINAERNAMKNILAAMRRYFERGSYNLSENTFKSLVDRGEKIDLEYFTSNKGVRIKFQVPYP